MAASECASSSIRLRTALTDGGGLWRLRVPIVSAPMAGASGGALAAAVARAGALGFVAVGHGTNLEQLRREVTLFRESAPQDAKLALGFIGYSSCSSPGGAEYGSSGDLGVLHEVLAEHKPAVVQFFAPAVVSGGANIRAAKAAGCCVLAQVGTLADAHAAIEHGCDGVIAQGKEAGGHGLRPELGSGTFSLARAVRRAADAAAPSPQERVVVLAAGGVVDGAGLAACLSLGCDGAVVGTRFWASDEAMGQDSIKKALLHGGTDAVVRTTIFDALQNCYSSTPWPAPFDSVGALRNHTTDRWWQNEHGLAEALGAARGSELVAEFKAASAAGDPSVAAVLAGEGVGLIDSLGSATDIVHRMEEECLLTIEEMRRIASI
jgi:nitronate monooxygenase